MSPKILIICTKKHKRRIKIADIPSLADSKKILVGLGYQNAGDDQENIKEFSSPDPPSKQAKTYQRSCFFSYVFLCRESKFLNSFKTVEIEISATKPNISLRKLRALFESRFAAAIALHTSV